MPNFSGFCVAMRLLSSSAYIPAAVRRVAHGRRWRWLLQRPSSFLGQKFGWSLPSRKRVLLPDQRAAVRKSWRRSIYLASDAISPDIAPCVAASYLIVDKLLSECHHLHVSGGAFSNGQHHASELEGRNEGTIETYLGSVQLMTA